MVQVGWPAYTDDWRGNRIRTFKIYRVKGATDGPARIIDVCTSDDVVQQICLATPGACTQLAVPSDQTSEFSHRLYFPDGPGPGARQLFNLLSEVLSVRVPEVDVALALDWYKIPPDADHAEWRNTEVGELRYRAKYYKLSPSVMRDARDRLIPLLVRVIQEHPLYAEAEAIVTAPGHDTSMVSCGEDLAERLAAAARKPIVRTLTRSALRLEAKTGSVDLTGEFSMPLSLSDRSVIIADDALQSGNTMRHVALAARQAGASRVLGLVPVRTMRG